MDQINRQCEVCGVVMEKVIKKVRGSDKFWGITDTSSVAPSSTVDPRYMPERKIIVSIYYCPNCKKEFQLVE
jgi:hypothetical protein